MNRHTNTARTDFALEAGELDLVHQFWPKAFISERFILDSKDSYPLPWMVREIVQNFLDHGRKLSLDDVTLKVQDLPHQSSRIVITGAWSFARRGAVLALHGTKGADDAGANAIGLKQVLIRCCRDFGVSRFAIQGDGWDVNYHLASATEINARLQSQGQQKRVQFGWLVPEEVGAGRRPNACHYVIESDHPQLVAAFGDFFNMGVHAKNPYLLLPNFTNEFGTLKWRRDNKPGRMFVKGQVMNFRRPGPLHGGHGTDYWRGPEGVSLSLPKANYRKSIDRPAISEFELGILAASLIESMSKDELVSQLKASEHLWSHRQVWAGHADPKLVSSKFGFLIIVRKIVDQFQHSLRGTKRFTGQDYARHFGSRKYVCLDQMADDEQAVELEEKGYRICPAFFELIHMPRVSDQFDAIANAKNHQPDPAGSARRLDHLAREVGIPVGFDLVELSGSAAYLKLIKERLDGHLKSLSVMEPNTIRFAFDVDLPNKLLSHPLYAANTDPQRLLLGCRTLVANGLRTGICVSGFFSQGKLGSTFAVGRDETLDQPTLISATVDIGRSQGVFLDLEFAPDQFEFFRVHLTEKYEFASSGASPTSAASEAGATEALNDSRSDAQAPVGTQRPDHKKSSIASASSANDRWKRPVVVLTAVALAAVALARVAVLDRSVWRPGLSPADPVRETPGVSTTPVSVGDASERFPSGPDSGRFGAGPGSPQRPGELITTGPDGMQPDLTRVVQQLVELVESTSLPSDSVTRQFYGGQNQYSLPTDEHLVGRPVNEIAADRKSARIDPADLTQDPRARQLLSLQDVVDSAMDRLAEDHVEDFQIIANPRPWQLEKLQLLRAYAHETTGAAIANALFIYQGTGSSGINIDRAGIGIHEQLLHAPFPEAIGTFMHEVAHNGARGHGVRFEHTLQALFVTMNASLTDIANKADAGVALSRAERAVLETAEKWRQKLP